MEILTGFSENQALRPVAAIALGTFDGVHVGHQRIIRRAIELARRMSGKSMVFTSVNHPLSCLFPARCPKSLTKSQEKAGLISALGVDLLTQFQFTPEFCSFSPRRFIELIQRNFEPKYIVVGSNYTFGFKGGGTVDMLRAWSRQYGYRLEVPESFTMDGVMVSSTEIRRLISAGSLAVAEQMLNRPVQITGYIQPYGERRNSSNEFRLIVEVEDGMAVPCDGMYNVGISVVNSTGCAAHVLTRLSRGISMKKDILRIELQILGPLNALANQKFGYFARFTFAEILSGQRIAAEG